MTYETIIKIAAEDGPKAKRILEKIQNSAESRNESFQYTLKKLDDKGRCEIKIFSKNEDTAHKRGTWLKNKVFDNPEHNFTWDNHTYKVKKQTASFKKASE